MHSVIRRLSLFLPILLVHSADAASRQVDLEAWLSRDLLPYVSQQLTTQPRFRNELLRFVVMTDENPQSASNKLALALRDRLRNSLADVPGIRISVTRTSGCCSPNASSSSPARSKLRVSIPSPCNAFSSTQRIDESSSTIQTTEFFLEFNLTALQVPAANSP